MLRLARHDVLAPGEARNLCCNMCLFSGYYGKKGAVWLVYLSCGLIRITNEPMALGNRKLLWIYIYIHIYIYTYIHTYAYVLLQCIRVARRPSD